MKADDLLDSLEHVDPELVAQADKPPQKAPHRRPLWMGLTAVGGGGARPRRGGGCEYAQQKPRRAAQPGAFFCGHSPVIL